MVHHFTEAPAHGLEPEGEPIDDLRLEGLGYKPELKRAFSSLETFGVAFSIMGVVPSIASTIMYALPYGGPVGMVWGWALASTFILFIGLAMGELASSMPTSGGLYYWTHKMAPEECRDLLAWLVGYNSFLGNCAATSSLAWSCASQLFAARSLVDPDFNPPVAATFGLYVGVLIVCGIYCAYGTTIFARMQTPSVILNVALALVTIIGLPIARRKELNTGAFTFGGWANLTGWPNGFAFILSFLAPLWTIGSFDCAVSISEEASNAATAVPQAIVGSIASAGVLGTLVMIMLALCMGTDVEAVNDSAIGQPMAFIYHQAFGSKGSVAIWSFMCLAQFSMTSSLMFPASRQAFAFARDGALPFSGFFYQVNRYTGTPVRTVWLMVVACIPLGCLCFADQENLAAINAIFALCVLGPYTAYGIPIASRILWGQHNFFPGPFSLGKFSRPVSIIAVVWMAFAIVVFCFPADVSPGPGEMNYAIVVSAAVWAFALGYWYLPKIGGKTFFRGPITTEPDVLDLSRPDASNPIVSKTNSSVRVQEVSL